MQIRKVREQLMNKGSEIIARYTDKTINYLLYCRCLTMHTSHQLVVSLSTTLSVCWITVPLVHVILT